MNAMGRAHLKTGPGPRARRHADRPAHPAPMSGTAGCRWSSAITGVVDDSRRRRASIIAPMLVSRRMFERQLDWIGRRFRFVSLDELGSRLESGQPFSTPTATVTFDDGYRDMYEHAFPVLEAQGDSGRRLRRQRLDRTRERPLSRPALSSAHARLARGARGPGRPRRR